MTFGIAKQQCKAVAPGRSGPNRFRENTAGNSRRVPNEDVRPRAGPRLSDDETSGADRQPVYFEPEDAGRFVEAHH
jgi:hypothetical protein